MYCVELLKLWWRDRATIGNGHSGSLSPSPACNCCWCLDVHRSPPALRPLHTVFSLLVEIPTVSARHGEAQAFHRLSPGSSRVTAFHFCSPTHLLPLSHQSRNFYPHRTLNPSTCPLSPAPCCPHFSLPHLEFLGSHCKHSPAHTLASLAYFSL